MKDTKVASVNLLTSIQINKNSAVVRLPTNLHKKLKIECASRGVSMTDFVVKAIEDLFKKLNGK